MINIHFFGCSYTAGDELSDDTFFPWKKNCKTQDEYFSKRLVEFHADIDKSMSLEYDKKNKELAYPNKIKLNGIKIHNHAICGSGVQEQVLNAVEIINKTPGKHIVYFQIPPGPRKLVIRNNRNFSIQINDSVKINDLIIKTYITSSIRLMEVLQFSIEDVLELLFLKNYLSNKHVPCYLIAFGNEYEVRKNDVNNSRYDFLINDLENSAEIISFNHSLFKYALLGGHFNEEGHTVIANRITEHIIKNYKSWNT